MKIFRIQILLVMLIISSCTSMTEFMNSLMGKPIGDAIAILGAPESKISRRDGGETYIWNIISSTQLDENQCRQLFVTNSSGIIVSWSHSGCPRFVSN